MAVIDLFESYVRVNHEALPEYEPDEDDIEYQSSPSEFPTVKKYIQAQSGQNFKLKFRVNPGFEFPSDASALRWTISFDGQYVCAYIMFKEDYLQKGQSTGAKSSRGSGSGDTWLKQYFRFKDLDITQDSIPFTRESVRDKYGPLGSIEIEVWPWRGGMVAGTWAKPPIKGLDQSVPEKALKGRAVTLSAGLDAGVRAQKPNGYYSGGDIGKWPLAKFIFEYRTKKSLQELMIIERDDIPTKTEDIECMTADQLRATLRRERAMRDVVHIKDESDHSVKRERGISIDGASSSLPKRLRRDPAQPIEVIVLD